MSSKAGYLKQSKNLGHMLQQFGQQGSNFYDNAMVQTGFGAVGRAIGQVAIPIPIVGGTIGKMAGESLANTLSYTHGLVGEIGGLISGEKNIGDVLSYVPKRIWNDFVDSTVNSDTAKVIRGEMNWRDAAINKLEEYSMVNILAPNKTHAWKDAQGNYHKQYVDGAKMVVGEWKEAPAQPRPDINSNAGILGVYNGEVYRRGFDDARWTALQQQGKVK